MRSWVIVSYRDARPFMTHLRNRLEKTHEKSPDPPAATAGRTRGAVKQRTQRDGRKSPAKGRRPGRKSYKEFVVNKLI